MIQGTRRAGSAGVFLQICDYTLVSEGKMVYNTSIEFLAEENHGL